ncbi:unnamed protein product [Haemonchus placei]|uniref:Uncharacterized protein n=1 Tax=Haemonchus placei TaxID=6290 RepID=A0A0N4X7H1_HAEPC|nr:unnamed protein product [Haemonchus placei]
MEGANKEASISFGRKNRRLRIGECVGAQKIEKCKRMTGRCSDPYVHYNSFNTIQFRNANQIAVQPPAVLGL